jgi:transcriptional regulator with GAF, ATPase, and Fis domain
MDVLLLGETGVGKGVAAERIHYLSGRKGKLIQLNCAGLTAALLETQLFGHVRGAFTGAIQSKQGLLEVAKGGTVFLDEVGEMPLEVQAKLLVAIEKRAILPVGATETLPIDVRFI